MRNATTKQPKRRIDSASATSYEMQIKGPEDETIGTLSIDPKALNAIVWLRSRKQDVSKRTKTVLNLVESIEADQLPQITW